MPYYTTSILVLTVFIVDSILFNQKKNNKDTCQLISSIYMHYTFFLALLYWIEFLEKNLPIVLIVIYLPYS